MLCFIYFFAIHDGSYNVGLSKLFDTVLQEITVEHGHIGEFAELDGAHAMLLFFVFHPSCDYIESVLRVLRNELLDDFSIFYVIGQAGLQ